MYKEIKYAEFDYGKIMHASDIRTGSKIAIPISHACRLVIFGDKSKLTIQNSDFGPKVDCPSGPEVIAG